MLRVKICGITRPQDALLAAELGADAIGLVFYEQSPRYVTAEQARSIVNGLPPWLMRVGVFVDVETDLVKRTVTAAGLTAIQLHGQETPEYIHSLEVSIPVIKAVNMKDGWQDRVSAFDNNTPILLDAAEPNMPGGSGCVWDWRRFDQSARPNYFILAGGLTPENVRGAVESVHPDAIDVSTGVEQSPGIKDPTKLSRFFDAVREVRTRSRAGSNG